MLHICGARPVTDVRILFQSLQRAGLAIGIATTCQKDEMSTYDAKMHAMDLAEAMTCGGEVKHGKPHPDLFRATLDKLNADPSSAVAIGDSPYDLQWPPASLECPALVC